MRPIKQKGRGPQASPANAGRGFYFCIDLAFVQSGDEAFSGLDFLVLFNQVKRT
jgi:hypothetical protein